MKILKTNENKAWPKKIECKYCGAELEVEYDDIHVGALGMGYFDCPVCKKKCYLEDDEDFPDEVVTVNNLRFPDHFFHSSEGVDISSEDIRRYVENAITFFRNEPDAFVFTTGSGNTAVIVFNYSGDENYHVIVSKDYYDTYIDYEQEDYDIQNKNDWKWVNKGLDNKDLRG